VARTKYALAVGTALLIASLVVLGLTLSSGAHPSNRDYAPFGGCPLSNPATDICIFAQTESGELTIGRKAIPITKMVTLQGGVHQNETTGKQEFIGARDGNTLSRVTQIMPGGLGDIIAPKLLSKTLRERFYELIDRGAGKVMVTTELAAPASAIGVSTQNLIEAKGIGLSLPVKLELSNALLGDSCYIGSNAKPIVINLSTGRKGKPGHAKFKDEYNLVTLADESLVGDSFAAPRAEGCGGALSSQLDLALDAGLGLPVARGENEALLNGTLRDANAPAVRAAGAK
jgi:hypothetical protein